jgi:hypothetical protein
MNLSGISLRDLEYVVAVAEHGSAHNKTPAGDGGRPQPD